VFVAILIIFATVVIARGAASVVSRKSAAAASAIGSISLFINVTETLVAIVGGLVVMQYLGISVAPILTAFGIGGLAVALALQDTLANFFSGIQIAASRQVHAGDLVRIDADNTGTVVDINWRNTVLRDADGNRIIVPNQKLAQAIFTAYRRPLRVPITVTLDRSADFGRISDAARQTASEVANPLPKDEIEVRFGRVADRSVDMVVTVPARDASDRRRIGSEFATAFLKRVATEDPKGEKIKAVAP
jgi:small-conductance mechanosensitive channel